MSILGESSRSFLLAVSMIGVVACGGDDTSPGTSKEPGESDRCLLRFDSEPVRWSAIGVGYGTSPRRIDFSNVGDEICTVTVEVTGAGFTTDAAAIVIAPEETRTVAVTWTPTVAGPTTGTLRVTSDDLDERIALEGEAVASCLSFSPDVVDFGQAAPGCSTVEKEVLIENACSHPATIARADFESDDRHRPDGVFAIRGLQWAGLPPGTTSMEVAYRPQEVGEHTATLRFTDANGAVNFIELVGEAQLETRSTDTFEQGRRVRTDLLFVVDDSPAMAPYSSRLRSFGEEMATRFMAGNFSTRFAVTTTSRASTAGCSGSGADGRLVPFDGSGPRWLDTESGAPSSDFGDLVDVGTCSEAPNEGLAAAVRAVTDPLASQTDDPVHPELDDGNLGFRRPGLGLSIIFVSASDDTSTEAVEDVRATLVDAVGGLVSFFYPVAIVAPAGGCDAAEAGTRYAELASWRGEDVNLCDDTTWRTLLNFGSSGPAVSSRFFLTARPQDADGNGDVAGEIIVEVDGAEVAAIGDDGEVRWTFDAEANAVDFAPDHIPAEGSEIRITYFQTCG